MNEVIALVEFAGAWLLVAGPRYQGSVELGEPDIDREGIEGVSASAIRTLRQFTSFRNKATGWFTVAAGGTLLAVAGQR
jgi:hypothetical protein